MRKTLILLIALMLTSCGSIQFRFNSVNPAAAVQPQQIKVYSNPFETFRDMGPRDFGLNPAGNYIHCRTHGFHDLNRFDLTYSPMFCRPTTGFIAATHYNSAWNNGFQLYGNSRFYWNNVTWNSYLGNVHYGGWNNLLYGYQYGWNGFLPGYGWNGWNYIPNRQYRMRHGRRSNINGRRVYRGRRATNESGRWESTTPVKRINPRTRTNTRPNVTPTRTNTRPNSTPTRTVKPIRRNTTPIPTRTRTTTRRIKQN